MLKNYSSFKKYNTSKKADLKAYTDADAISSLAVDALKWANAEGIINGVSSTQLMPSLDASRAEAAAILTRFIINCTK